ncbi:MAG TPA: amidohydrolase family protein, partial [Methylomirabilota bacterium]|nr:amidohydrolase family protein [Methylomirabilota bacterium]
DTRSRRRRGADARTRPPRALDIEPAFKDRAPRFEAIEGSDMEGWQFEGRVFPAFLERPDRRRLARIRRQKARARHLASGRDRDPAEDLKGDDPRSMLQAMGREGIDVAVVFRTMGSHLIGIDGLDPALSAAVCRAFNHWLADFCDTDRVRLKPAAVMPLHEVGRAVEEARRAVRELGAVALVLSSHPVNGRAWYDPVYDPFWAEAERLGVPVAFHGIQMAYQEHLGRRFMDNFALAHAAAHPVEMMLALGSLLAGGVLERFPGLRAAFLEGSCSWVPWWLWTLDERVEKFGDDERVPLSLRPSEYFRRQCWVSVDPDEDVVRHAIPALGDDNIVISSDWPHDDSAYPRAIETFLGLDGVSEASKRKILWDNCARLYGLS